MPLTAMSVYKNLPRTNCGDCGFPTCMAFAMQVAAKQKAADECPHLSEEARAELLGAAAPPMKLIHIGPDGDAGIELGQETVMFRHEEKFHRPPAIAVRIPGSLTAREASAKAEQAGKAVFERVGQELRVRGVAVGVDGLDQDAAAERTAAVAETSGLPVIIMGSDPEPVEAATVRLSADNPLVYKATLDNADEFIRIAAENGCPLAVGAKDLEKMADLAQKAVDAGVENIILAFDGHRAPETVRNITTARRAALKKNFRPFGFPAMVDVSGEDQLEETILAATFVAKYAGIVLINSLDGAELMPILATVQNIYTDPQVPNTVEAKLYEIGDVDENSPVFFTTNFALTYFSVEGEIERSKVPAYICVVDTEGLGVLNAFAGDKISAEKVVKTLEEQKVAEKVTHRKLIIPGLLPSFRAEIEDTSPWKEVIIGPERANGIPAFLTEYAEEG